MQQVATAETVARAIRNLEAEGQKVTGRAVLAITGGSLGTVLQHIRTYREQGAPAAAAKEIPESYQGATLRLIGQVQAETRQALQEQITAAQASEAEALEGLSGAEQQIKALTAELDRVKAKAEADRQAAEKAAAVATEKIEGQQQTIEALQKECRQLIEAGEAARTEATKAQMQVERADQAAEKAEAKTRMLEEIVDQLRNQLGDTEKALAKLEQFASDWEVIKETTAASLADAAEARQKAEVRAQDLEDRLENLRERLESVKIENAELRTEINAVRSGAGKDEKR